MGGLGGVHRDLALVRANALVRVDLRKVGVGVGVGARASSEDGAHARETADVVVMPVRQEDALEGDHAFLLHRAFEERDVLERPSPVSMSHRRGPVPTR